MNHEALVKALALAIRDNTSRGDLPAEVIHMAAGAAVVAIEQVVKYAAHGHYAKGALEAGEELFYVSERAMPGAAWRLLTPSPVSRRAAEAIASRHDFDSMRVISNEEQYQGMVARGDFK